VEAEGVSDAELVRRIAARGEPSRDAETELCRRFAPRIRLYGLRHLRDEERARDLTQAVLLAVLEAVRGGRVLDHERVDRFILGTCRNTALRVRERDARAVLTGDEEGIADVPVAEVDRVELQALFHCLGALEGRARRIVLLSFHEGRDAEEIAGMLEMTSVNVRVVRHRAVAAVRRCLDADPEAAS
jgi:RNA polymerase sigma-70 factor (ECF subfamily)